MLLPIFLQTVNNITKKEFFGNDVNLTEINAKLEQLSKASIPGLTKEELEAALGKFKTELLEELVKEGDSNPIKKVLLAVIAKEFETLFAGLTVKIDDKLTEFTTAQNKKLDEILVEIKEDNTKRVANETKLIAELDAAEKKLGTATNNADRLVKEVTALKEQLAALLKDRTDATKKDEAALANAIAAEVLKQMPKTDIKPGNVKQKQKTGDITVQAPNLEPIGKAIEAMLTVMTQTNAQNQHSIDRIIGVLQAEKQAAPSATQELTASIAALKETIASMKTDTTALEKIITIEKEHKTEIVTLMKENAAELKAMHEKYDTKIDALMAADRQERTATNNKNRAERVEMRREFKEILESMTTKLLDAEKAKTTAVASGVAPADLSVLTAQITQLASTLAEGLKGFASTAQSPTVSSQPLTILTSGLPGVISSGSDADIISKLDAILQALQSKSASASGVPSAPAAAPAAPAAPAVVPAVVSAPASTASKKINYNFTVMPTVTPPTSQQINIVDAANVLFAEVEKLFAVTAPAAAPAATTGTTTVTTPPLLTPNKYYFVIGYETPASGGTATQLKYEFTTMINLTKHTSDIKCVYAVSGEEKGPITINCMMATPSTDKLNDAITTYTSTHHNKYIIPAPTASTA